MFPAERWYVDVMARCVLTVSSPKSGPTARGGSYRLRSLKVCEEDLEVGVEVGVRAIERSTQRVVDRLGQSVPPWGLT